MHGTCNRVLDCKCGRVSICLGKDGPECKTCSPLFQDAFFDASFDLERGFFDGFIYHAGGKRINDLVDGTPDFSNADYIFEIQGVIVELKILKTEFSETDSHQQKFEELVDSWRANGRLNEEMIAGRAALPEVFITQHMFMLRKQIEGISKKANRQIRETKERIGFKNAKGLVIYLNDGFYVANPNLTLALIGDPLRRQMTSIGGYVLINLRKRLYIRGDAVGRLFWLPKYRDPVDHELADFVDQLGSAWFDYFPALTGQELRSRIVSDDPENRVLTVADYEK